MRGSFRGPDETLQSHFSLHRRKISTREINGLNRCWDMLALLMRLSVVPTDIQCLQRALKHCTLSLSHWKFSYLYDNETTQDSTADAVPPWYRKMRYTY